MPDHIVDGIMSAYESKGSGCIVGGLGVVIVDDCHCSPPIVSAEASVGFALASPSETQHAIAVVVPMGRDANR